MKSIEQKEHQKPSREDVLHSLWLAADGMGGESILDNPNPSYTDHESHINFLENGGYDTGRDMYEIDEIVSRAVDFANNILLNLKADDLLKSDIGRTVDDSLTRLDPNPNIDRLEKIFMISAGKTKEKHPNIKKQALLLEKILITWLYFRSTDEYHYQKEAAESMKKWLDKNFGFNAGRGKSSEGKKQNGWLFKNHDSAPSNIKIHYIKGAENTGEIRAKLEEHTVRKLMAKKTNRINVIDDLARARIVTEGPADLIRLIVELVRTKRLPVEYSINKTPKHQIFDWEKIRGTLRDPEKYKEEYKSLIKILEENNNEEAEKFLAAMKPKDKNPHSSSKADSLFIPYVFERAIAAKEGKRKLYKFEIQFSYKEKANLIWSERSPLYEELDHDKYAREQYWEIGQRVKITVDDADKITKTIRDQIRKLRNL